MRVEYLITSEGKERYMVVDDKGEPVEAALRYIKYKDNIGTARNTLRAYCYHLKLFFQFLEQEQLDYRDIGLDEMAAFMRWLQTPYRTLKITSISPVTSTRSAQTINVVISTVIGLYDYLMRHEDYSIQLLWESSMRIGEALALWLEDFQIKREMTDPSKDILIAAKNKRLKELENENKRLKEELVYLRGKIYDRS